MRRTTPRSRSASAVLSASARSASSIARSEPGAHELLQLLVVDSVLPCEPLELVAAVESEDDLLP